MRKEQELLKVYEECRQMMVKLGYDLKPIPVSLNSRLRTTLGRHIRSKRNGDSIEINAKYFQVATDSSLRNTILHELCHQADKKSGHGVEWKAIAKRVSDNTPYKISTYATKEETEMLHQNDTPKKYGVKCTSCGHIWKYKSQSKVYKHPDWYSCPYCKTSTLTSVELL